MSKKGLFEQSEVELSKVCKALGHPARIKIIKILLANNNQTCKEIVEKIPLSQSTVSQHLAELRDAELIIGKNFKTSVIYSVDKTYLSKAQRMLSDFLNAHILNVKQSTLF
ncbi:MAG: metalloregulator ArsR/SmtB family transcription factor [Bacteroidota bacterium]|nr:metalloregulator ArsR/SmtB family transcription factor [Bacteroidota bacterium]